MVLLDRQEAIYFKILDFTVLRGSGVAGPCGVAGPWDPGRDGSAEVLRKIRCGGRGRKRELLLQRTTC